MHRPILTPDLLLRAYAAGVFPMAEHGASEEIYWVEPERRGILPLDRFHVSRSLAQVVRQDRFEVRTDTAFAEVMAGCAATAPGRTETWINAEIVAAYTRLHMLGHAHSIEAWRDGRLAGGLYGVALAGAFFGESMFSRETDASKVALVHLVARLKCGGFTLLDTQYTTAHLERFGAIEISRARYQLMLRAAMQAEADFRRLDGPGAARSGASGDAQSGPEAASVPAGSSGAASSACGLPLSVPGARDRRETTTVSGPVSGKCILQLVSQTS